MANDQVSSSTSLFPLGPVLRNYSVSTARRDFVAALTVALFAIPQAMAYALIAGFPPTAGIVSTVVASILGAAFGSSAFLISGPTNAISVMLAANAVVFASQGDPIQIAVLLTLMIGLAQLVAALIRLGAFTRFVSEPVLTGFTAGAGIYIAVNQLPSVLGLHKAEMVKEMWGWSFPANCLFDFARVLLSLGDTNTTALIVGGSTFVMVRVLQRLEPRIGRRLPAPFLTVLTISLVSWALELGDPIRGAQKLRLVMDIEPIVRELPSFVLPSFSFNKVEGLLGPMLAIGVLGAVEAIAISKVLAAKVGHSYNANQELLGQGLCNIGTALVGGFASSGSFTRSAVNFDSGAATRVSGVLSGFLVLGVVLAFAPAANYIPIPVLAGTLIHIGLKLVNVARMKLLFETTIGDRRVLMVTFLGVLLARHLEFALFLGIAVSLGLALKRAEGFKLFRLEETAEHDVLVEQQHLVEDEYGEVVVIDVRGEMFFAAAEELEQQLKRVFRRGARFLVLRVHQAYNMDATCVDALTKVSRTAAEHGGRLLVSGVRPGTYGTFERGGLVRKLGADCIFRSEDSLLGSTFHALKYARKLLEESPREGKVEANSSSKPKPRKAKK